MELSSPLLQLSVIVLVLLFIWSRRLLLPLVNTLLSRIINVWLLWCYPLKQESTGQPLPTLPYEWPNGQGNVEKFLHGRENSSVWAAKYGSVYRIWSGMTSEVVLTTPEHIKAVFFDSDKHSKAIDNNSGFFMHQLLGSCLGLISTSSWRCVRAIFEPTFHRNASQDYVDLIQTEVTAHFDSLAANQDGRLLRGLLDPVADFKMLPFFIVVRILYGELPESMKAELRRLAPNREELFHHVVVGGLTRFRWSQYLPSTANRNLANFRTAWEVFNAAAYAHAKQAVLSPAAPLPPPIIEMWESTQYGAITRAELLQTLDEILFANLDVTMGSISWNIIFLAAYPDIQQQLRAEVAKSAINESQLHHQLLLSSTTLLSSCILESARLRPLAAFSVPQSCPTSRILDGYLIPAGTNFIVDAHALNSRSTDFWGPDASHYKPERFLKHDGTALRYRYWRFGFGPRQCLGKYVADVMVRALLARLVQGWELGLVGKEAREEGKWEQDMEMWIAHPRMEVRCLPVGDKAS